MDKKELFYEADTRKHQQLVMIEMVKCAKRIIDRGIVHDASKFTEIEKQSYIEPVYKLNTREIEYGSDEYKKLTAQMGEGWNHHKAKNDHHPEFFEPYSVQTLNDPIRCMDLFCLMEMLCDWIAASKRRGNEPSAPLKGFEEKYKVEPQLIAVLANTLELLKGE